MAGARSNIGSPVDISAGKGFLNDWVGFSGATRCPNGDLLLAGCTGGEGMATAGTCVTDFLRCPSGSDPKIAANWTRQSRVGFVDGAQEIWMRTFTDGGGTFMMLSGNVNHGYGTSGPLTPNWYQQGHISRSTDNGHVFDAASSLIISDRPNIIGRDGSGDQHQDMTGGYVQLPDLSIIAAVCIVPAGDTALDTGWILLIRTTDRGATWSTYGGIPFPPDTWQYAEPSLFWMPDGTLVCMARVKENPLTTADQYTMWLATSADLGVTWPVRRRCFTKAASRPIEVVGPEGDVLVAYRQVTPSQVSGKTAWRQSSDLVSWTALTDIGILQASIYGQGVVIDDTPGVNGNVGFVYQEENFGGIGRAYFLSLTAPAGWSQPLTITPTAVWSLAGSTVTITNAPALTRSVALGTVNSVSGGLVRFAGTHADRFSLSLDGVTWAPTVTVPAGATSIRLGVTPQALDTTLSAQVGVPV